jgi:hypothetical protein
MLKETLFHKLPTGLNTRNNILDEVNGKCNKIYQNLRKFSFFLLGGYARPLEERMKIRICSTSSFLAHLYARLAQKNK